MRILVTTERFHENGRRLLDDRNAEVRTIDQYCQPAELEAVMAEFDPHGLISRTVEVTARAIDAAPSLRVIAKTGVGFDNVDLVAATRQHIPVMFCFGVNSLALAEHALAMIFSLARNTVRHGANIRAGKWSRFFFPAHEIEGKRLGIVGYGQSGQHLARKAEGIGMQVSVFAPRFRFERPPPSVEIKASFRDLCVTSDIISLHCPLNPKTRGMVDAEALSWLPAGAMVINVARGPMVDQTALVEALRSGHVGGAGLDTFEEEPIGPDNPLLAFDNVVVTPHVGGSTLQSTGRAHPTAAQYVLDALDGRPLFERAIANPEVLNVLRT